MEISELTIRLMILMFPGIIVASMYSLLQNKRNEISNRHFFVLIIIFGVLSYVPHTIIYNNEATFFKALLDKNIDINLIEIVKACVVAFFLGLLLVLISNYRIIYRLADYLKISNKSGELRVWDELFKKDGKCINRFINIDIPEENKIICGFVSHYSTSYQNTKELILKNVKFYESKNRKNFLGSLDELYLCLDDKINYRIEIGEENK